MSSPACDGTTHSTPKGLNFTVHCNQDTISAEDFDRIGAESIEDCLDRCSQHTGALCRTAAFDSTQLRCHFKKANTTTADLTPRTGWTVGIASPAQLRLPPPSCGGSTGHQTTTPNGLNFTVYCNQDIGGNGLCGVNDASCLAHADSLDECLDFCATTHPRCTSVSWRPDMIFGWLNCYPKNASAFAIDNRYDADYPVHVAKALLEIPEDPGAACVARAERSVVASGGGKYGLECDREYVGADLGTRHAGSVEECVDACEGHGDGGGCVAAVFDVEMLNRYENCYLKNSSAGASSVRNGFTLAVKQASEEGGGAGGGGGGGSGSGSSDDSTTTGSTTGSKAWIAGPVVGVAATILLIFLAPWWRRRRRRRRYRRRQAVPVALNDPTVHEAPYKQAAWMRQELDTPAMTKTDVSAQRHELDARLDARPPLQELEGSPAEGVETRRL